MCQNGIKLHARMPSLYVIINIHSNFVVPLVTEGRRHVNATLISTPHVHIICKDMACLYDLYLIIKISLAESDGDISN